MSLSTYTQKSSPSDTNTAGAFAFDTVSSTDYAISKLAFGALGSVTLVDAGSPLPVTFSGNVTVVGTGTFAVQAAQSGTWNVGTVTSITNVVHIDDNSSSLTVDNAGTFAVQAAQSGSWTVQPGNTANTTAWLVTGTGGTFPVTDSGGSLTVDDGGLSLSIDDGAGSITVDGTVAATQSGTWNIGTLTSITNVVHIDDNSSTLSVDDGGGSLTVDGTVAASLSSSTNAGATAKTADYDSGAGTDTVTMFGMALPKSGGAVAGGTSTDPIRVDPTGSTAQPVSDNGGNLSIDDGGNVISVDDGAGSLTVDNGGTFAVQAAQSGTWNIGTVTTITNVVHVDDNSGSLTVDNNGTFAVQATLQAGTALIGRVSASDETSTVYNGTTALTPKFAKISTSSSGASTVVSAVGGKKLRVLKWDIVCNGAVNVKWQSHVSPTDLTGLYYFSTNGGIQSGYCPAGHFETVSGEALDINLSGAVAVGGSLTYVEV